MLGGESALGVVRFRVGTKKLQLLLALSERILVVRDRLLELIVRLAEVAQAAQCVSPAPLLLIRDGLARESEACKLEHVPCQFHVVGVWGRNCRGKL